MRMALLQNAQNNAFFSKSVNELDIGRVAKII